MEQFTFEAGPKDFQIKLKRSRRWSSASRRLLIVLETLPIEDLKANEIDSRDWLPKVVDYATSVARRIDPDVKRYEIAYVNFNNRRHLHLKGAAAQEAVAEFGSRMNRLIEEMDPTHILFSGDLEHLYSQVKVAKFKNGWVHKIDKRSVTSTLDFEKITRDNGTLANLLGFWCRHLANLMVGRNPYEAKDEVKPVLVDTVAKFDKVMAHFDEAKEIAVDTETRNLTSLRNRIYTIQLAFDTRPGLGYFIPVDHPHKDNPFSKEQRAYIKRELAKRFGADPGEGRLLITFNGAFDLRVIKICLKLPIILWPVYEIMAGEHSLDENASSLRAAGVRYGDTGPNGLGAVLCSYGNDFYFKSDTSFSKGDRANIGTTSPIDPGFVLYGATDAVSLHGIKAAQLVRASHLEVNGKPYTKMFLRHVMHQMSDTVHVLAELKQWGSMVDRKYLRSLLEADSKLVKALKEMHQEFRTFPEVREANRQLLAESGFKAGSLFAPSAGGDQWVFSFNKGAHKAKLFFDIMKLKAVNQTATGADAVDKDFIATYKDRNFLVAKYGEYQEATKLLSTYAKGWYRRLVREIDGADSHLRADFLFHPVDTGRLASANPNFQNIATRGKLSKIIKEMFVVEDGRLLLRYDFSAHEVRGWSIMAKDKVLASAFKAGQQLRQQWIKCFPPKSALKFPLTDEQLADRKVSRDPAVMKAHEIATALKKEGDIHIQNVYRFFRKWISKSDPLRDAVKGVVFGVLYGKSAKTLGHDTKKAEIDAIRAKMNKVTKDMLALISQGKSAKDLQEQMDALAEEYQLLQEDDRTDYAQSIIDKMFQEFTQGKLWIDRMVHLAKTKFYVYSPIGRVRHLYAAMLGDRQIMARQVRRGMNAPGQGFASEIAVKAARITLLAYYKELPKLRRWLGRPDDEDLRIKFNRIVHDASYFSVPWCMVLPAIHIQQYQATYGVAKAYEDEFGLTFTVEPEIEMEVGVKDTLSRKWDWAIPNLLQIIEQAVDDGIAHSLYTSKSREEILEEILKPWTDPKIRAYLNKKYPLLNVDLDHEIEAAVTHFGRRTVRAETSLAH